MATVDELKTIASSRLGFARSNNFLITVEPLGNSGLGGLLKGVVGDTLGDALGGFIPSVPGLLNDGAVPSSREINILCKNASIPGKQILTADRLIGMRNEKVAYGYAVGEVNLTFYLMNDYGIMNYINEWQKLILDEDTMTVGYKDNYAKRVVIHQLRKPLVGLSAAAGPISINIGAGGGSVYSVELIDAFPTQISSIDFSNDMDGLVEVSVSLSYTRHKKITASQNFLNVSIGAGQIF